MMCMDELLNEMSATTEILLIELRHVKIKKGAHSCAAGRTSIRKYIVRKNVVSSGKTDVIVYALFGEF